MREKQTHPLNPIDPDEFNALKKKWYQKLRDEGFKDIETEKHGLLKTFDSTVFSSRYDPTTFESKETYYRLCGIFLHHHKFETRLDKAIWELHTNGKSFRESANILKKRFHRQKINKDKINGIVDRLVSLMRVTVSSDIDIWP